MKGGKKEEPRNLRIMTYIVCVIQQDRIIVDHYKINREYKVYQWDVPPFKI